MTRTTGLSASALLLLTDASLQDFGRCETSANRRSLAKQSGTYRQNNMTRTVLLDKNNMTRWRTIGAKKLWSHLWMKRYCSTAVRRHWGCFTQTWLSLHYRNKSTDANTSIIKSRIPWRNVILEKPWKWLNAQCCLTKAIVTLALQGERQMTHSYFYC